MPVFRLGPEPIFPDPSQAEPDGLLAVGGDLSSQRLLTAYATGIFPWYEEGLPILWWSPDPRLVLYPADIHVSRKLERTLKIGRFEVRADTAFRQVMSRCAVKKRPGQHGTWITGEMLDAYTRLHEQGFGHSIETWRDGNLVGGLYGLSLGSAFFGESMFADETDASKVALVTLARALARWGFDLIDCQVTTQHLVSMGAVEISREAFLEQLEDCLQRDTRRGTWDLTA